MLSGLLQAVCIYAVFWLCWRILKRLTEKSPLDNIPGPPSRSILTGNFHEVFDLHGWDFHDQIAAKYGGVIRIIGPFSQRQLYVFDPKALHHIVVKDQHVYEETSQFIKGNMLIFGPGLLSTLGDRHRKQRKMLNPVFSINHMRRMIPTFYTITHKLRNTISSQVADGPKEIDMLHWMSRTALELLGQNGLGYSFDSLEENAPAHPFHVAVKNLVPAAFRLTLFRFLLLPYADKLGPRKFRRLLLDLTPWRPLRQVKNIVDVMHKTAVEIYEEKKRAISAGADVGTKINGGLDIMSIMMRANRDASEEDRLEDDEVIGQMATFMFAGMDTTSSALSRTLHLLSEHLDVQEKLRAEIVEAREQHGDLDYDRLVSLPYLDAVCRETLRLYPPLTRATRTARKDIVLPLGTPIIGNDGKELREIAVPKDTDIFVSILSANRDPNVWGPDVGEWKPERWLSPLPTSVTDAHVPGIYSHLMTFFGGSRACIGFKFSQLEMKVVLSILLEVFIFEPPSKEIIWLMTGLSTPSVKGEKGDTPRLPMKVTKVPPKPQKA